MRRIITTGLLATWMALTIAADSESTPYEHIIGESSSTDTATLATFSPPSDMAAEEKKTILWNFRDVDLKTLIGEVSRLTGRNFIVDSAVTGNVTVISAAPMNTHELYELFLSILQVHGFVTIPSQGGIKIVPEFEAQNSVALPETTTLPAGSDQISVTVATVENANVATLAPLLRPLTTSYGHLVAYPPTNAIIIADRASNVQSLLNIIKRVDLAPTGDIDVMKLEHASVIDMANNLRELIAFSEYNFNPEATPLMVSADTRTNSILLSGPANKRLQAKTLIAQLDIPAEGVGNTQIIYLQYLKAEDIEEPLQAVVESYAAQQEYERTINPSIKAEKGRNALIVTAQNDLMNTIKAVVAQLDQRRAQVYVEVIIAEITDETLEQIGVDITTGGAVRFNTNFDNVLTATNRTSSGFATGSAGLGLGYFAGNNLRALARALSTVSTTNVLSTPNILTLDNEEAEIQVGREVSMVKSKQFREGDDVNNPILNIDTKEIGLKLKITPHINEGNTVQLAIEQELSSLLATVANKDISNPDSSLRKISSKILVDDGEIIAIGGLIDNQWTNIQSKVPVLGSIPILKYLFGAKKNQLVKTNLMIFLRPVIIRDMDTGIELTQNKYYSSRRLQLEHALKTKQRGMVMPKLGEPLQLPHPFPELIVSPF